MSDLTKITEMKDLSESKVQPVELGHTYWTPDEPNETKRGVPIDIREEIYEDIDEKSGEVRHVTLNCVIFAEQIDVGKWKVWANGSKRLVATIINSVDSGLITLRETPIQIVYLGKIKNKTNSFKSDSWEIRRLK